MPDIDTKNPPRHIAIIMDGNGRWAEQHNVSRAKGHEAGARSVRAVIEACRELDGADVLSLFAFSTENWRRSKTEVDLLFKLLSKYVKLELDNLHKEDIQVIITGRRDGLSSRVQEDLRRCEELTRANKSMILNLAVNYGGRAEIADTAKRIARQILQGDVQPDEITEEKFSAYLYAPDLPDIDLLIRTSGEFRISNFMLWQASYAEFLSMDVLWPDFRKEHLYEAITEYQNRQRRFGGR